MNGLTASGFWSMTLVCVRCGAERTFYGRSADEIYAAIDSSGWLDRPERYGDLCPDCDREMDDLFGD
jgi:hypothetical protein